MVVVTAASPRLVFLSAALLFRVARSVVPPCIGFTGIYSGLNITTSALGAITSVPLPGTQYSNFGRGRGSMTHGDPNKGWTKATMSFDATGNATWSGQFRGCAQLTIGQSKQRREDDDGGSSHTSRIDDGRGGNYMILSRDGMGAANWTGPSTAAPAWVRDLVIYEIAPKGFTSPNGTGIDGSGSGTWVALTERIDYLAELGVTGIWLAGFCVANSHFFGVWSVYATIQPDVLDPSLGTEVEFKAMIDAFHAKGIKVMLDVVTHGVTFAGQQSGTTTGGTSVKAASSNRFLAEHPELFFHLEGENGTAVGKWLMADYNYEKPSFHTWWTNVWLQYVLKFDIDGFRLDGPNGLSVSSTVLHAFDAVAVAAKRALGKSIAIFAEETPFHFGEHDTKPSDSPDTAKFTPSQPAHGSVNNGCFKSIMFSCHDGGFDQGVGNYYGVRGSRAKLGFQGLLSYDIPIFFAGDELDTDAVGLPALTKGCYSGGGPGGWLYGSQFQWVKVAAVANLSDSYNRNLNFSIDGDGSTPSAGGGVWTPTQAHTNTTKKATLADVRKLLAIRKAEKALLHADRCAARVVALPSVEATPSGWQPYARIAPDGTSAIIVVGNPQNNASLTLTLRVNVSSWASSGNGGGSSGVEGQTWTLSDLWNDGVAPRTVSATELLALRVVARPDQTPRGGLAVLKIIASV